MNLLTEILTQKGYSPKYISKHEAEQILECRIEDIFGRLDKDDKVLYVEKIVDGLLRIDTIIVGKENSDCYLHMPIYHNGRKMIGFFTDNPEYIFVYEKEKCIKIEFGYIYTILCKRR